VRKGVDDKSPPEHSEPWELQVSQNHFPIPDFPAWNVPDELSEFRGFSHAEHKCMCENLPDDHP
jgi:hypothetical protein